MGDKSRIEWTDATWTPIRTRYWEIQNDGSGKERIGWHCEHVSEGCRNCYAESMNRRLGTGFDFKPGHLFREEKRGYHNGEANLFLDETMLLKPLYWRRARMVFACSMTDIFADFVPDEWIDKIFDVMDRSRPECTWNGQRWAREGGHIFQILTKRSARMKAYLTARYAKRRAYADQFKNCPTREMRDSPAARHARQMCDPSWDSHIWLGVSTERQQEADERIPDLLATPAAIRFVSAEPLLGPIDFTYIKGPDWPDAVTNALRGYTTAGFTKPDEPSQRITHARLDQIIVGGESGRSARPMHPDWARSIRDQCQASGVPFFFKQFGHWREPVEGEVYDTSKGRAQQQPAYIVTPDGNVHCFRSGHTAGGVPMLAVGKKRAGRLLDGRTWDEMPSVTQRVAEVM